MSEPGGTSKKTRHCLVGIAATVLIASFGAALYAIFAFRSGYDQQQSNSADKDCTNKCTYGTLDDSCLYCTCENSNITGKVSDVSGRPIRNAVISRAENPLSSIATTDITGKFIVHGACAEEVSLIISKAGYKEFNVSISSPETPGTVHVDIVLLKYIRPNLDEHPQSKVRLPGQNVKFCCHAYGTPEPDTYEWFKDNTVLDTIATADNSLILTNVTIDDSGKYKCRANSEAGSVYSLPATLEIIDDVSNFSCQPDPKPHFIQLPEGCEGPDGSSLYNVGKCASTKCASDFGDRSEDCTDTEEFCCKQNATYLQILECDSYNINISIVTQCACSTCSKQKIQIRGRAAAADNGDPFVYGEVYVNNVLVDRSSRFGEFSFEISRGLRRLSVTFKDRNDTFVESTKILPIGEDINIYHQVYLQRKAQPVFLNSSETTTIPLGNVTKPAAELGIPPDSFLTIEGELYTGNVSASITFADPTDENALAVMQSDFSTIDVEGNSAALQTFGVISMDFKDDNGNNLVINNPVEVVIEIDDIDDDIAEVDKNGIPLTKLWTLNPDNGAWEEAGSFEIVQDKRKKRSNSFFIVGYVEIVARKISRLSLPPINVDKRQYNRRICYLKIRVYGDEGMTEPLQKAKVTGLVKDRYGSYARFQERLTDSEGSVCLETFCDRSGTRYSVHVKVEHDQTLLLPLHPKDAVNHPGTWSEDILDGTVFRGQHDSTFVTIKAKTPQMAYEDTDFDDEYAMYDYDIIDSDTYGPFYWQWWLNEKAKDRCEVAKITENHVVFVKKAIPGINTSLFKYNVIEDDYESDRSPLSWYPYEDENKVACVIKILVDGGPSTGRFRVASYGGSNDLVRDEMFGLRIDDSKPGSDPELSHKTAACVEFKCSGTLKTGQPFEGEGDLIGTDNTTVFVAPVTKSKCRLKKGIHGVNTELIDYLESRDLGEDIHRQTISFSFKAPNGSIDGPTTGIYMAKGKENTGLLHALENCYEGYEGSDTSLGVDRPDIGWALQYDCQNYLTDGKETEYEVEDDESQDIPSSYSWYPNDGDDKKACFVKIAVQGYNDTVEFGISSYGGGHPSVGYDLFGFRIKNTSVDENNYPYFDTAACIEYRCNGVIYSDDQSDEQPTEIPMESPCLNNTIIEITRKSEIQYEDGYWYWGSWYYWGSYYDHYYYYDYYDDYYDFYECADLFWSDYEETDSTLRIRVPNIDYEYNGLYIGHGNQAYDEGLEKCINGTSALRYYHYF